MQGRPLGIAGESAADSLTEVPSKLGGERPVDRVGSQKGLKAKAGETRLPQAPGDAGLGAAPTCRAKGPLAPARWLRTLQARVPLAQLELNGREAGGRVLCAARPPGTLRPDSPRIRRGGARRCRVLGRRGAGWRPQRGGSRGWASDRPLSLFSLFPKFHDSTALH